MPKASLSTHVLDTTDGVPAAGLHVELFRDATSVARATTDADGRISDLARDLDPGTYRLVFETSGYAIDAFFSRVALDVELAAGHTHVPLLLSRFGITSYRGS